MIPLAMVAPGEEVRLTAIRGGQRMRRRLADLGLNLGLTVRVIQRDGHGPLILAVKDSRLALGRGVAHKIMVELI
ncbi:MAG: FeoA family protein [Anaerolineae bacterium]